MFDGAPLAEWYMRWYVHILIKKIGYKCSGELVVGELGGNAFTLEECISGIIGHLVVPGDDLAIVVCGYSYPVNTCRSEIVMAYVVFPGPDHFYGSPGLSGKESSVYREVCIKTATESAAGSDDMHSDGILFGV